MIIILIGLLAITILLWWDARQYRIQKLPNSLVDINDMAERAIRDIYKNG